ncbi:unnamed protein product, partial [Staurois parvus]
HHSWCWLSITGYQSVITRWHPEIAKYYRQERELYVNSTVLSPVSSCTLFCMAQHGRASAKHTHRAS